MNKAHALSAAVLGTLVALQSSHAMADFYTPGDLVVLQVGLTGSVVTLQSTGTAVQLDEFTTAGAAVPGATVLLPTSASGSQNPLTISGTAGSEGALNLSANGAYLVVGGYDVGVSGTTQGSSTVGLINASGNVDTSTTTSQLSGNNTRSATSSDGSEVWVAGASGTVAQTDGSSSGNILSTKNVRVISIVPTSVSPTGSTQLYVSSDKTNGISSLGSGLPTSGSASLSNLSGMTSSTAPDPFAYFFANSSTLFVADGDDGIQEWTRSGSTWSVAHDLAGSYSGLTGAVSGSTVDLYYITANSSGWIADNSLVSNTFNLSTGAFGTADTLATTSGATGFSGVAFSPTAIPEPASAALVLFASGGLLIRRRRAS